jgi:Nuclease subunit of the excinuclease complex
MAPYKKLNKTIPALPGVYLFKDIKGEVIYIGKAISLKNRVASYFQNYNTGDWKVDSIINEYVDLDYIITTTEHEAMLLEAELIQTHQPKFNTIFKTGQPFLYILFAKDTQPTIKMVRNKTSKGVYFGPFLQKAQARSVYNFLMRTFNLNSCNKKIENGCLDFHLGNCAGTCKKTFDRAAYTFRLELAKDVLANRDQQFIEKIKAEIKNLNSTFAFEQAQRLSKYLENVEIIFDTIRIKYSAVNYATEIITATTPTPTITNEYEIVSKELSALLHLPPSIKTIDCFDISHFQSNEMVGSCVRFSNGKPDKDKFRRFKINTIEIQNDYAALAEIVSRRYKEGEDLPDLIVIDGGKGQLNAVQHLFPNAQFVSLAKREERVFATHLPEGVVLDLQTPVGRLLIALRDYAHHFAITYHRFRRNKALSKKTY